MDKYDKIWIGIVVAIFAVLAALMIANKQAKGCGYACLNFICVEDADCPESCACARRPWTPQGECV